MESWKPSDILMNEEVIIYIYSSYFYLYTSDLKSLHIYYIT